MFFLAASMAMVTLDDILQKNIILPSYVVAGKESGVKQKQYEVLNYCALNSKWRNRDFNLPEGGLGRCSPVELTSRNRSFYSVNALVLGRFDADSYSPVPQSLA